MTMSYCLSRANFDAVLGDLDRVADAVAGLGREDRHAGLLADDLQLGDGVRALEVGGDQERRVALAREPLGELAGERRLSGALEAGEHDDGRRLLGELEAALLAAEDRDELLVDDLHDLLGRVQRLDDLVAEGALAHLAGEVLDDVEGDVGVEQGATDLADGAVDIRGAELALAAEVLEGLGEAVGEISKSGHGGIQLKLRGGSGSSRGRATAFRPQHGGTRRHRVKLRAGVHRGTSMRSVCTVSADGGSRGGGMMSRRPEPPLRTERAYACPECGTWMEVRQNPSYGTGLAVHPYILVCGKCGWANFIPAEAAAPSATPAQRRGFRAWFGRRRRARHPDK